MKLPRGWRQRNAASTTDEIKGIDSENIEAQLRKLLNL